MADNNRYSRNRLYLTEEEQQQIKEFPILLGGSGIGSVIAEAALRMGFENITLIDGDKVELSNLNRQNYTENDIGKDKAESIYQRLKSINSNANIQCHNCFLTEDNVSSFLKGHKAAINALDFTTKVPLLFDKLCQQEQIPVLHPYNLGWGGLVAVIMPNGLSLETIAKRGKDFNEVAMVEYVSGYLKFWNKPQSWIDDIVSEYKAEKETLPPPQLSIASWTVAAMCTHLLFNLAIGKEVRSFPKFYLSSIIN